jgi:hypothetical protein
LKGINHQTLDKTIQRRRKELLSKIKPLLVNYDGWFLNQKQGKFLISVVLLGNE